MRPGSMAGPSSMPRFLQRLSVPRAVPAGIVAALLVLISGCQMQLPYPRDATDAALFGPVAMRIHPIFTQIKDWTGDDRPDGIEALIELQDQFGDPTKASGRVIFELYEYRPYDPDIRGRRLVNPWIGDLSTLESQRQRWNRTSRTYGFQLAYDGIRPDRPYVLTATFELNAGGRFFDRIILEPTQPKAKEPRGVQPEQPEPTGRAEQPLAPATTTTGPSAP
ncbi:hypothetical protein [Fontivita pretiosa]|uniref:hypothetical protein n=1 Tax=Fontivita pretiosa TaxID=2989684 RepID=UPI003D174314